MLLQNHSGDSTETLQAVDKSDSIKTFHGIGNKYYRLMLPWLLQKSIQIFSAKLDI